ncbi:ABC transporter substrate-binding protein [Castellaniella sp.]|uniref:ABC transporter substrate-binding protein n=1 Tax=Castellaniella sp. TaxID=1955812 RepID=UPI0035682EF2
MNGFVYAAAAAAIMNIGMVASAHAQISGNVIRIGFITDMSGLYAANDGPNGAEAIRMAIEDAMPALGDVEVELLVADHQNKADLASSKAREWLDQQDLDLLVGGVNSSAALAMARVAGEKKKVHINIGAASPRLTNEECNPYTIHYAYSTTALARSVGKAVLDQGGKDWFFITADYAFGHSFEEDATEVIEANGGTVKGSVRHPLNAPDFSSYMLQAHASGAKILGLANGGPDTVNAIKAAREFGVTDDARVAALQMDIIEVKSMGLDVAQGMLLATGFYWDRDDESRAWAQRYFERTGSMPSMLQAGDYSAVSQYLKAVAATGTDDADVIMDYLKSHKISDVYTASGVIRPDGRMAYDMSLFEVKSPDESKGPWDLLKLVTTVPADIAYGTVAESKCPLVQN